MKKTCNDRRLLSRTSKQQPLQIDFISLTIPMLFSCKTPIFNGFDLAFDISSIAHLLYMFMTDA